TRRSAPPPAAASSPAWFPPSRSRLGRSPSRTRRCRSYFPLLARRCPAFPSRWCASRSPRRPFAALSKAECPHPVSARHLEKTCRLPTKKFWSHDAGFGASVRWLERLAACLGAGNGAFGRDFRCFERFVGAFQRCVASFELQEGGFLAHARSFVRFESVLLSDGGTFVRDECAFELDKGSFDADER